MAGQGVAGGGHTHVGQFMMFTSHVYPPRASTLVRPNLSGTSTVSSVGICGRKGRGGGRSNTGNSAPDTRTTPTATDQRDPGPPAQAIA